jgi:hypothetical protein
VPDRVLALLKRVDYRRADTTEKREAIFLALPRLLALREIAIAPNASERSADILNESGNSWIFGVYIDGKLASSIRLHVASRQFSDLPALNAFCDLLSPELAVGKTIMDPTRFVIHRAASKRCPELCNVITCLAWLASEYFQTHLLLATVRAEHQAFHRRVWSSAHLRAATLSLAGPADQLDGPRLRHGARAGATALPLLPVHVL